MDKFFEKYSYTFHEKHICPTVEFEVIPTKKDAPTKT